MIVLGSTRVGTLIDPIYAIFLNLDTVCLFLSHNDLRTTMAAWRGWETRDLRLMFGGFYFKTH